MARGERNQRIMMSPCSVTAWLKADALRNVCVGLAQHALNTPPTTLVVPGAHVGITSWTLTSRIRMAPMNPKYIEPTR